MEDKKGNDKGVPAGDETKPEEEIVDSSAPQEEETGSESEAVEQPAATDTDTEASEPETPADNNQENTPAEPDGSVEPATENVPAATGNPEEPAQTEESKPKHRFHITKKVALISLCALVVLGGAGAFTACKLVAAKKKPVSLFSKTVVEPFKVATSTPAPDATDVGSDSTITMTFNRAVDPKQMKGDFFLSPQMDGTFSQGKTPEEVVFTPSVQFTEGTKYQFMIHGEFTAKDGSKLGADYFGKFTTALPGNGFHFIRHDQYLDMDSMLTGTDATYSIATGDDIKQGTTVTVYKSDVDQLLRSFIYKDQASPGGGTYPQLTGSTVSTDGLSVVSTKSDVQNDGKIDLHADAGVYLAVAVNGGKQVGHMWVVASDYGVLLRQDDQNAVVALQHLDGSGSASGNVDFYNLNGGVKDVVSKQIDGQSTVPLGFTPRLDMAVAHVGGQVQVVPVAEQNSLADIRSMTDLSSKPIAFGATDKPSYQPDQTVNFAGYLRTDNDAAYTNSSADSVQLYVASYAGGTHLADMTAPLRSDGTFKGSFTVGNGFIPDGEKKTQLHIYAAGDPQAAVGYASPDADVASFTATNEAAGQFALQVAFTKSGYLPTDKVTANIMGINADGSPLANTSVSIDTYASEYSEGEIDQSSYQGNQVDKSPATVQLDGQGKGSFTVDVSQLPSGSSQGVTVVASKSESNGTKVAGSAKAVVHQGDAVLQFGPSRTVIQPNGTLVARVYARTLSGSALSNATIDYTVTSNSWNKNTQQNETKQLASGTVTSDGSGYATISQALSNAPAGSITLTVTTGDSQNNKVQNHQYYYVNDDSTSTTYSDVQLEGLDVYGSRTDVKVGDTLHLAVDAPQAVHALMSLERGRVYDTQMLDLHAGKNDLTLPVTQELMPSFNLVFSYFSGGQYHVDGVPFDVDASQMHAAVSFNSPTSIKANSPFALPLNVTDASGKGLATRVIFSASESSMFNTASPLTSPIFAHLYAPRELTTNSSSSLTAIGTGGGKCGGGGDDLPDYILPSGAVVSWQPDLTTDGNGQAKIPLNLPKGRWHLTAYVMSQDNIVGSTSTDVTAE